MDAICDLVLLSWNHLEQTQPCLESLFRCTTVPCRLLIVDNGSEPEVRAFLRTVTPHGHITEVTLLPPMGDSAIGILTPTWYTSALDNPENRAMSRLYQEKYREEASEVVSSAYVAAVAIVKALEAVGGRVEDTQGFLQALRKVGFNSPQGPFRFDENQNLVFNLYATRVEKAGGKLVRSIVEKIADNVDQFWTPK